MATLSDRSGEAPSKATVRPDQQDDRLTARRSGKTDTAIAADDSAVVGRAQVDEDRAARSRLRTRTEKAMSTTTVPVAPETEVDRRRPRASLVATTSLILGVVAALTVLTGLMASPGVGLGILAVLVGIGGLSATSRRHVAGKTDALLGMALGLAAVVVGTLALAGALPWLNGDTNQVLQVHEWLVARLPWLFPSS